MGLHVYYVVTDESGVIRPLRNGDRRIDNGDPVILAFGRLL